jgi:aldehyde:ferredoxin oxidoreductase
LENQSFQWGRLLENNEITLSILLKLNLFKNYLLLFTSKGGKKMNFLRVNANTKTVIYENASKDYELFGGRALIAKLLNEEVDPKCDPLGPDNKLIICPGLLTGTSAPCSGRLSVGAKSPLTGGIKEANAGGTAAQLMAKLDLKAIIIEDQPNSNDWYLLKLSKDNAELISADEYIGMNNYALAEKLQEAYGKKIGIISIGGAGERGYKNSTLQVTDPEGRPARAAARGGLGSVMASKRIKAIVLDVSGPSNTEYADKDRFTSAAKSYSKGIMDNPVSGQGLPALGTAVLVNVVNAMGALSTNNFSQGTFEHAEMISGEYLAEMQGPRGGKQNHKCHPGCVIGCSNIIHDEKGEYLTSGFEYETIGLCGSNCGISSLDTIAKMDRMCDDFGLDTMETGCTIGVCMESGKIAFGDEQGALNLIQEMIDGTELGKILGNGTDAAGKYLGVKRIPTVKGQAIAAYDPRALKGTGVTYATSPMGGDHTAGNSLGNPTVDPCKKEGQVDLSTNLQVGMATFDALGMCIFSGFCTADPANVGYLIEMLAAKFGHTWDADKVFGLGVQTIALEKAFNRAAGFTMDDDMLPEFFYLEPLSPKESVFDIGKEELSKAIPF